MSTRRRRTGLLVALAIGVATAGSCRVGASPAASPVATSPHGATVSIDWRGSATPYLASSAELLAVADSGVFLLHTSAVVFYPMGAPARLRALDAPGTVQIDLQDNDPDALRRLTDYARHPFGLGGAQMERLLGAIGSDSVVVRRSP